MKKLVAFGIGSSVVGTVLLIVGIATVRWMTAEKLFERRDVGLWQACDTRSGVTVCKYWPMDLLNRTEHTCRSFAVWGSILAIAGVFTALGDGSNGGSALIAAGFCGVISACIFTLTTSLEVGLYGYSLYLTYIQALLTIGGGIAITVGSREGSTTVQAVGEGPTTGQPVTSPV
ncbi:uncharacterized protein LOC144907152 [Branchiostoma floridae x Branchiostoma belcheri]